MSRRLHTRRAAKFKRWNGWSALKKRHASAERGADATESICTVHLAVTGDLGTEALLLRW